MSNRSLSFIEENFFILFYNTFYDYGRTYTESRSATFIGIYMPKIGHKDEKSKFRGNFGKH